MFTAGDGEARRSYAVLGHAVRGMLEASATEMLGKTVFIRGIPFEIMIFPLST